MQLRNKINRLGDLLLGMGAARRKVPWPTWFDVSSKAHANSIQPKIDYFQLNTVD